ncbi:hypothetical protein CDL12_19243 [Handroanthus impetiginosus]|uniref:Uncharacterized protein n=1 Tax=Handroanthus impetiginosus TaxID=429701 RepID=A0A2G9GSJ0_9LAMI|nr:hypothetical protein CDL12_19243 [Handroanthus impetiginosus]
MVSLESLQRLSDPIELNLDSSPARISFSSEFLDEDNFISICPNPAVEIGIKTTHNVEFEFLSGDLTNMITADELICAGKLLPFWQMHEKLDKITLKSDNAENGAEETEQNNKEENRMSWFPDDDPSPRPPKCTVLWKELLRLKKQRGSSTLLPSSSSSSASSRSSLAEMQSTDEKKEGVRSKEKEVKRSKKSGLERIRTSSIRVRPMVNVPVCTKSKNGALPPLFSLRKGRVER